MKFSHLSGTQEVFYADGRYSGSSGGNFTNDCDIDKLTKRHQRQIFEANLSERLKEAKEALMSEIRNDSTIV